MPLELSDVELATAAPSGNGEQGRIALRARRAVGLFALKTNRGACLPERPRGPPDAMSAEKDCEPALSQASMPAGAVFLSYTSEDSAAVERIASALRAGGIEVWFDKSELRGGDAWDRQIRQQIRDCRLFLPIISAHSQARAEGYFRLEWDLADQRTHLMGRSRAFLVPVCLDATLQKEADVPDSFVAVQWTRLPDGETPPAFVDRVRRLLSGEAPTASAVRAVGGTIEPARTLRSTKRTLLTAVTVVILGTAAYFAIDKSQFSKPLVAPARVTATPLPAAFSPPPHSIAVLPFVNMSGEKEQEYFSDGLTEELLNSLARINELQVSARTSSFSFKGKDIDIGTIARKLNVGAILEGSVRRSGHTIRVTAQLNNAVSGFHLWSQTYDRDLRDVLQLQSEIANAVAIALKAALLGDVAAKIEVGGTRNPAAFDAYLRGSKAYRTEQWKMETDMQSAVAAFTEAIRLDPNYALAFAGRSMTIDILGRRLTGSAQSITFDKALADARRAIALEPDLGEAHLALARVLEDRFDFVQAGDEYSRALSLAPGSAQVLQDYGAFTVNNGGLEPGLTAIRHALTLDPLSTTALARLGEALWLARRYSEAVAAFDQVIALDSNASRAYAWRGFAYYGLGDFQKALSSCEAKGIAEVAWTRVCLALVYNKLGRHNDAEAMFAKDVALIGDAQSYQYAEMYAQWGNVAKALEWLETAVHVRDTGLGFLKMDPLLDPLRQEPRFQAIERALKFPE